MSIAPTFWTVLILHSLNWSLYIVKGVYLLDYKLVSVQYTANGPL